VRLPRVRARKDSRPRTSRLTFPVVRAPGQQFLRGLNVNRAPVTLRVAEGGRVEDVALGVIDPIRLGEMFAPPKPSPR
jgi:hypothetical protein